MITIQDFWNRFQALTHDWDWAIKGFLDTKGFVHPIDTDTKVISTVFERLASPVIRTIAAEHGYAVELANQTTYPDFTLSLSDRQGKLLHRIALDVKTTYRSQPMGFTLGGYNSFLRNGTKNILYPYATYSEHWVLGFIYSQNQRYEDYALDQLPTPDKVGCPYKDVFVFLRNKHEITGLRAGSGNTKNIGSVKLRSDTEFATVRGPFAGFTNGKAACDQYWAKYEDYVAEIDTPEKLLGHRDFNKYR